MEKLAVSLPLLVERLLSPSFVRGDDEWESDGEKSPSDLVTSPHSDHSACVDRVTSSPLSNLSLENCADRETAGAAAATRDASESSSGATSPVDRELRETVDTSVKSLAERLSVSGAESEGCLPPQASSSTGTTTASSLKSHPSSPTSTSSVKLKPRNESLSPNSMLGGSEVIMKEETSTPSPPILAPTTPRGPSSPTLSSTEVEAARQQISNMIQGLPILSMLPALHRLAPVVSLASGLGNITTSTSTSSSGASTSGILCVCGIRFSSATNLEAHRMFYCTHRPTQSDDVGSKEARTSPSVSPRGEGGGGNGGEEEDGGRILRCPHCSYTTTHKLSLNGHMNIHTSPEEVVKSNSSPQSGSVSSIPQAPGETRATDRYCGDCDIQFSSVKNYRVHKAHYCQTRHVLKGGNKSPVREDVGASASASTLAGLVNAAAGSGQPILALPTNPILLVPYSLVAGAQLLPPHVLPQAGAAVVLPNGQVQPLSPGPLPGPAPPPLLSPVSATAAGRGTSPAGHNLPPQTSPQSKSVSPPKQGPKDEVSKHKSNSGEILGKRRGEGECPLDLTTKRPKLIVKTDLLSDEEKENREVNTPTPAKSPVPKSRPGSSHGAGEFEGKLLASPPRPSPSSEGEGQSNPRSPRPGSAAPTLGSPRGLAESPRPSTSMRSPGQHTQIQGGIPQLPPGFPNILAGLGLESLSGLSLASLQSLQGVPPDLALKLLSPDLLMNGLAPIVNPPVIVKQGEAKCNECNIVFYKEESLQVHKKHYCAARSTSKSEDDRHSSGSRSPAVANDVNAGPSRRSPSALPEVSPVPNTSASVSVSKDAAKPSKPLLQFICSACGIKFTSPDNLAAHQTYYCPKREGASNEEGVTKGLWRCPRCRCAMPETLQAAHQCVTPSPAPSHGWKCPCCPVISPTAAAAQKHLETHAGIKAFRCTICGYRGNTLRGMRTHIRMHFEKRTNDLQEENFIACILEDDDGSCRAAEARGVADLPRVILENPTLSALLAEGAAADRAEQPLSCHFCPFVTPFRSNLARHLALAHKVGFDAKLTQDLQALLENRVRNSAEAPAVESEPQNPTENGNPVSPPPLPPIKLEPEVKLEVEDSDDKGRSGPALSRSPVEDIKSEISESASSNNNGKDTPRHCKACNITFSYLESFLAHKRFYCTKPESSTPPETAVQ
ncbi:zinc finger protein ush isoform X2 [Macrobrachium rosenbergii]|uniref:zinc finger protein ush isoform X2 n=1 Tax=Macrobrachium rosenbergii TaxID=79674 RepID=UPI0034D715DD